MDRALSDRRVEPRASLPPDVDEVRATLRPGRRVCLIDVSRHGALLQSGLPMRPGSRVHLQVMTGMHSFTLIAQVLRCIVWSLHPEEGVTYRGAVRFEHRCDVLGELVTRAG